MLYCVCGASPLPAHESPLSFTLQTLKYICITKGRMRQQIFFVIWLLKKHTVLLVLNLTITMFVFLKNAKNNFVQLAFWAAANQQSTAGRGGITYSVFICKDAEGWAGQKLNEWNMNVWVLPSHLRLRCMFVLPQQQAYNHKQVQFLCLFAEMFHTKA